MGQEYDLTLKESAVPCVHAPRWVPLALKDALKTQLDDMVKNEVISPVKEPTDWVSSLVVVEKKNKKLRICIDPRDLNKHIKRSHYPLPTFDHIVPDLQNAKVFSTFDARNGYWQVKLTERSSFLTTFNTPFGRYRWLRMPFGISSASEEYQRRMFEAVGDINGVKIFVDDILVFGQGKDYDEAVQDHDKKIHILFERLRQQNIKLNADKI